MDTDNKLKDNLVKEHPELEEIFRTVNNRIIRSKREIYDYQAAMLYKLALPYNSEGCRALEIGSAFGYSCWFIAHAMSNARRITTLNPKAKEYHHTVRALLPFENVQVIWMRSWDYLKYYSKPAFNFIFVDGDHEQVARDLPWFNLLRPGGLILFHDYAPDGSARPVPTVYNVLNDAKQRLKRDFDIYIVDDNQVGMVGWYRQEGEQL